MGWLFGIAYLLVLLFVVALLVRMAFDWVMYFAREWKPRGVALLAAEAVFTVTDPPLKALRRLIPPLRLGGIALDVAFLIVLVVCWVLLGILGQFIPA
ncbi:MAG TPA: YggT family protein [Candidatus Ruania gallistercoris]|uniref:YggT family protein n=1 Tax=Candidatus Ruania gallistercoris TaxID=2838746 RepID=A0A9D2EGL0_9MICO|nr:YggT family protein [Candidatus Ruania gallistercoris]